MDKTSNHDTTREKEASGLADKLRFVFWGVRYFDILVLMAYPTMGAVFAISGLGVNVIVRFLVFTFFNFLFVAHIYIYNDWSDARLNPEEPKRRARHALKHASLTEGQVLVVSAVMAAAAFLGFAFISVRLFAVAAILEIITSIYSHPRVNFKGKPVFSTLIHFMFAPLYLMGGWAAFMPLSGKAVCLAVFFGLVLAAGHFSNEIEDFEPDLAAGIRTNAIAFGQRAVFRVGLFLFLLSSIFFVYLAWRYLELSVYLFLAGGLLAAWLVQAWRFRAWKGGDPIGSFRRFYRAAYALFCFALISARLLEWTLSPAGIFLKKF